MWPWGHLAVGYICFSVYCRGRSGLPPASLPALAAAFGSQFPDLVDKPLAWTFAVLPNGRSLAHSLLVAAVVLTVVVALARRVRRPLVGVGFAVGYVSHSLADALSPAIEGDVVDLGYLAWPLVPAVEYETEQSFVAHFMALEPSPMLAFELVLVVAAVLLWRADGYPGLWTVLPRRPAEGDPDRRPER
jgi:hypothetical protein